MLRNIQRRIFPEKIIVNNSKKNIQQERKRGRGREREKGEGEKKEVRVRERENVWKREERMHYFQDDIERSNSEIQKRRYLFETHAKIVYGVETYTCEYNLFFAITLHLIRSLACRLRKMHKTDTTAPSSSSRIFEFFPFFIFRFYIQKHSKNWLYARITTRRHFFNQEFWKYINFSRRHHASLLCAFPCFFFLMTMKFFLLWIKFRKQTGKRKIWHLKFVSKTRARGKCNFQNLRIIIVRNTERKKWNSTF